MKSSTSTTFSVCSHPTKSYDDDDETTSAVVESVPVPSEINEACNAFGVVERASSTHAICSVVDAAKVSSDIRKAWTSSRLQKKGSSVKYIFSHATKSIDDDDVETSTTVVESIRVSSGIKRGSTRPDGEAFGMVFEAVSVSSDIKEASTSRVKKASSMQFCSSPRSTDGEGEAKNASSSSTVIKGSPPPTSVDDRAADGTPASFGATESTEERRLSGGVRGRADMGCCTTAVGGGETSDCNECAGFFEGVNAFAERVEDSSLFLFCPTRLPPEIVSVAASVNVDSTFLMKLPPEMA